MDEDNNNFGNNLDGEKQTVLDSKAPSGKNGSYAKKTFVGT